MTSSPSWITVSPFRPCGRDHRTARRPASRGAPREAGHHTWGIFKRRFWGESLRQRQSGPIRAVHGVVRWRLIDLAQWVFEAFANRDQQADLEPRTARAGLSQIVVPAASSCPRRRGRRGVQKNFAKSLAQIAEQPAAGQPIEIWFQMLWGRTLPPRLFKLAGVRNQSGEPAALPS